MTPPRSRIGGYLRRVSGRVVLGLVLLVGAGAAAPPRAGERAVAFTFDDLPANTIRMEPETLAELTRGLLAALERAQVPAIGFVNESKLYSDPGHLQGLEPDRVALLEQWLDAGHELGNHGFAHLDLHRAPVGEVLADLDRSDLVVRRLLRDRGREPRYFRHPFLHTGRSIEIKAQVRAHLEDRGYRIAPVTIDNGEYLYARAYDLALEEGDAALGERLERDYLRYMVAVFAYYEQQSQAILGYELPQILLLHANRLNAATLPHLNDLVRGRGYRLVTLAEALEDPAYRRPDAYLGPAGITWLHRWALADGRRGTFFAGEPEVPAWVRDASRLGG